MPWRNFESRVVKGSMQHVALLLTRFGQVQIVMRQRRLNYTNNHARPESNRAVLVSLKCTSLDKERLLHRQSPLVFFRPRAIKVTSVDVMVWPIYTPWVEVFARIRQEPFPFLMTHVKLVLLRRVRDLAK